MNVITQCYELEFIEPVLGLCSGDPEVHTTFKTNKAIEDGKITAEQAAEEVAILEKMKAEDEAEAEANPMTLEEEIVKTRTVFPRDEIGLFLWNYQMRGFFKEQVATLIELGEPSVRGLSKWLYRKAVDKFLFCNPRRIYLFDHGGKPWQHAPTTKERPLRGMTPQGERICLASSEQLSVGTTCQFSVSILKGTNPKTKLAIFTEETIIDCLNMGAMSGFGQWRSGGWGKFNWKKTENIRIPEIEYRNAQG